MFFNNSAVHRFRFDCLLPPVPVSLGGSGLEPEGRFRWLRPKGYQGIGVANQLFAATIALVSVLNFSTAIQTHGSTVSSEMNIETSEYGTTPSGKTAHLYKLVNANGNSVSMTDYGALIVAIEVPDREGKRDNVTLGFDRFEGYLQKHPYFGATVGRFCNRIAKGRFELDGKTYTLAINNEPNHLHGGIVGFDKQIWATSELRNEDSVGLRFKLISPDMQEGYPGTLTTIVDYVWDNNDALTISFSATTDKPTHVNLTNHSYFNLAGAGNGKITNHVLRLSAQSYLPVDNTMIPTGQLEEVAGTALDFRDFHSIGERIAELDATQGYDHCFVVAGQPGELRDCGTVKDPASGRAMEIKTTQPGVQLYTGNFLGGDASSGGFGQHEAFCLETQHFPDAPNQKGFLSTRLDPGDQLSETTVYRFFVSED